MTLIRAIIVFLYKCLSNYSAQVTPSANDSDYVKVNIPLALMRYRDLLEAQQVREVFYMLIICLAVFLVDAHCDVFNLK